MSNLFYNLYKYIKSNRLIGILILFATLCLLLFFSSSLKFEEDITKLIPKNEANNNIKKILNTVTFKDKIIIRISTDSLGTVEDLTEYASLYIENVNKKVNRYIKNIQGKFEDKNIEKTIDYINKHIPLFINENDYNNINNKINYDSIENIVFNIYKSLISPSSFITKNTSIEDPMGISLIGLKKLQELNFNKNFVVYNNFIISKNKNELLLFISPNISITDNKKNEIFIEELYKITDKLNHIYNGKISANLYGGSIIALANAKQIKNDIKFTISISLSILIILFILYYKKITVPFLLFIPTIFGGLFALAITSFMRDSISAISLGIASVLLGVTIDYSLHILTHIKNNNDVKELYNKITRPILMSSLTTSIVFSTLFFLKSQALQDLGLIASISVLSSSFFALILIPHFYQNNTKKNDLLIRISKYSLHKNKLILLIILMLFITSIFKYDKVKFNEDLSKMNFIPNEILVEQKKLDKLINSEAKSIYAISYGNSIEDALMSNDKLYNQLQSLLKENKILDFSSISSLIVSDSLQKIKINNWNSFWTKSKIIELKKYFEKSSRNYGFKENTFNHFFSNIDNKNNLSKIKDFDSINPIQIDDYISSNNGFATISSLIKISNISFLPELQNILENENTILIDREKINESFLIDLKSDFNKLVIYSLIIVVVILLIFYKNLSLTLTTVIPICITWFLTVGIMGALNIEFNVFNIIISTLIFGLGIDYSIFITNGLINENKFSDKSILIHKSSIIISFITTFLGIGVLVFANHPALFSISIVTIIGISLSILIAFSIQPIFFNILIGNKFRAPASITQTINSFFSFLCFVIGSLLLSIYASIIFVLPLAKIKKRHLVNRLVSKFMRFTFYTYPGIKINIINKHKETFNTSSIVIANHASFLDILAIGMLNPKSIFLTNDWVIKSPLFGKILQLTGSYSVSKGINTGIDELKEDIKLGYSIIVFPEGTRSKSNKINRFKKGAFFIAEKLNVDILPILIHGNHEILPKGKFIINKGKFTIKILNRIKSNDLNYGKTYPEKQKQISTYFKKEHTLLRKQIEKEKYFNEIILKEYIFKDNKLYITIKQDLNKFSKIYYKILDYIKSDDQIIHLSDDYGQLDFLLCLDSIDRNIFTYISNRKILKILNNSFITNNRRKIKFSDKIDKITKNDSNSIIINTTDKNINFTKFISKKNTKLFLLKNSRYLSIKQFINLGFKEVFSNSNLLILKK